VRGNPILLRLTLVIALFWLLTPEVQAQGGFIRSHVRSVTGIARIYRDPKSGAFVPKRNVPLEPGDIIETDHNGRVVILFSDGGLVTVLPNSKVVLKNYLVAPSARELLDIMIGRVLVKIRHVGGKPNPYRLNSPAASIAVRGTEFIVDVLLGGETLVAVREGQVEVWPHGNPGNKRLVTPGGRVIVRPGGDISSAFPGPGSELNGRTRFNRDLAEDYRRSVDSVAQNSNEISPVFFSAFPDSHLDSLENPAYAAEFKNAEGRLLMLSSISKPYRAEGASTTSFPRMDIDLPRFDHTISPQLTFYTPVPGSRLTVGGGVSTARTRLRDLTAFQVPGYIHYDNQALRLNAFNVSFIAAYSLGFHGRTSAGIGIDTLSGDGSFLSDFRFRTESFDNEHLDTSNARFARARLTFGLVHRFSEGKKIGLYYRHGINSSDQENQYQRKQKDVSRPEALYFLSDKTNISTLSSELGIRLRAPLTRRLFYGIEGSYLYERINSRRETPNQPIAHNRYLARRARLGGGLGFALTSKILLNLDIAGGLFNNTRPAEDGSGFSGGAFALASFSHSPRSARGTFLSAHAAVQTNLWRNFFLSASSLKTVRRDLFTYGYAGGSYDYKAVDNSQLSNASIGWKFNPNFFAEYLFSMDHSYRVPSHSLKLRYTFSLDIKGEK